MTDVSLPQLQPTDRPRGSAWRRRRNVLLVVQGLIFLHIGHWLLTGESVSPIEPSESMAFAREGVINAGFVLFALMLLSTALFGRWFCGWGCHVLLLQDACTKWLERRGIRPKPFRSRSLAVVPFFLAFLMFLWPAVHRWGWTPLSRVLNQRLDWIPAAGPVEPWPGVTYEFSTSEFWSTFPSFWIAIPFFLICTAGAVWFLGAKGYCTYACPYGGLMAPLDRLAPRRIVVDPDLCERCGVCTSVCTSHVRVHEEVHDFGAVVDQNCMKCGDCIEACPQEALQFGWATPPAFRSDASPANTKLFSMSRRMEATILAVWAVAFFGFHGLYNLFPLLMAAGMAALVAWFTWASLSSIGRTNFTVHRRALRKNDQTTFWGWGVRFLATLALVLSVHSLWIRTELSAVQRLSSSVDLDKRLVFSSTPLVATGAEAEQCRIAIRRHDRIRPLTQGGFALTESPPGWLSRAWCHTALGEWSEAIPFVEQHLEYFGFRQDVAGDLGLLQQLANPNQASVWYASQLSTTPQSVRLLEDYTRWLDMEGQSEQMITFCRQHRDRVPPGGPIDLFLMRRLSLATAQMGRLDESVVWFERTLDIDPSNSAAWLRLAEVQLQRGDLEAVIDAARQARSFANDDRMLLNQIMRMLDAGGAIQEAEDLRRALTAPLGGQGENE